MLFFYQVRGILAQLGYEKLDDVIGRTDLLQPRDISLAKTQHLDLGYILSVRITYIIYIIPFFSFKLSYLHIYFCVINLSFSECWVI